MQEDTQALHTRQRHQETIKRNCGNGRIRLVCVNQNSAKYAKLPAQDADGLKEAWRCMPRCCRRVFWVGGGEERDVIWVRGVVAGAFVPHLLTFSQKPSA